MCRGYTPVCVERRSSVTGGGWAACEQRLSLENALARVLRMPAAMSSRLGASVLWIALLLTQPALARAQASPAAEEVQRGFRGRVPIPQVAVESEAPTPSSADDRVTYALIGAGIGVGVGLGISTALWLSTEPKEPTASQVELHG